jgi:hypothetical protein
MVINSFGNRNFMQPMGRLSMHSKCLGFFSFKFWVGEEDFFSFFLCSLQVPNEFSICSQRVFSIAPLFNPICFAHSPPLLTYISGPKRKALYLCIESSILGRKHSFNFFGHGPIKLACCKKQKSWAYEAPPTN